MASISCNYTNWVTPVRGVVEIDVPDKLAHMPLSDCERGLPIEGKSPGRREVSRKRAEDGRGLSRREVFLLASCIREEELGTPVLRDVELARQEVEEWPDIDEVLEDAHVKASWEVSHDVKGVIIRGSRLVIAMNY